MKKYELLPDDAVKSWDGRTLYRIRAQVYGDAQVYGPYPVAIRSDGYTFVLVLTKTEPHIFAGCQARTVASYRAHINDYGSDIKKQETLLILDFLEAQQKLIRVQYPELAPPVEETAQ